eukprot:scaffold5233_cov127-Isochrysis_galbana.AAC.1
MSGSVSTPSSSSRSDEVVGVGDKVGIVPLLRRLLRDGRRARWGGWGLAFAFLRRDGVGRVTAIGMLSVFDPRLRRQAQSATGFFPRLEGVPRQCSVGPALSSRECMGRGLIRAAESSAI